MAKTPLNEEQTQALADLYWMHGEANGIYMVLKLIEAKYGKMHSLACDVRTIKLWRSITNAKKPLVKQWMLADYRMLCLPVSLRKKMRKKRFSFSENNSCIYRILYIPLLSTNRKHYEKY